MPGIINVLKRRNRVRRADAQMRVYCAGQDVANP